jgi:thiol-disulfide isomerase/thioredoxin
MAVQPGLAGVLNLKRLLAGAVVLALILLPIAVFLLDSNAGTPRATLLDTPPGAGSERDVGIENGKLAPNFAVSGPNEERVKLSDFRGRPVLINFWATWCTSCLSEMPEIKALQAEMGYEAFSVLAINAGESLPEAQEFIDFIDAPAFVYGLDPDLVVADAYSVYGLPLSVFIDSEGVVQSFYRGHADRSRLETFVTAAIEAKPPGPLPPVIRIVNTIPRDRVLFVLRQGEEELVFSSRSLRCDSLYCADSVVDLIDSSPGVIRTKLSATNLSEPTLSVRFDAALLPESDLVAALAAALGAIDDPVYDRPLEVRYFGQ